MTPHQEATIAEIRRELAPHGFMVNAVPAAYTGTAPYSVTAEHPQLGVFDALVLSSGFVMWGRNRVGV